MINFKVTHSCFQQLAIQASYGASRYISLQTLISLQLKLCSSAELTFDQNDTKTTSHRMSRIVTKLLARVLKAEMNEIVPFSMKEAHWTNLLGAIEEVLKKCNSLSLQPSGADSSRISDLDSYNGDHMAPCKDAASTFVHHVLTTKNKQGKLMELRNILEKAGCGESSYTGKMFSASCKTIGISPLFGPSGIPQHYPIAKTYDDDYLSELIFAVGGAEDDNDRVDAMDDLREYVDAHKDIDIQSHLSGVSGHFRKYILDQLRSPFRPLLRKSERSLFSG
jgi:hypothetical protein